MDSLPKSTLTFITFSTALIMNPATSSNMSPPEVLLQYNFFEGDLVIGIDADLAGDRQRAARHGFGIDPVDLDQRAGRGERVAPARADADDAVLRFEHVAGARQDQRHLLVGDRHHRFEPAQIAVGAPILGELDAGAGQLPGILFELAFESLEQGDRVGGGAGKTGDDLAGAEAAHLLGVRLDDGLAHRYLAVAGDDDLAALTPRQHRSAVPQALAGGSGHRADC